MVANETSVEIPLPAMGIHASHETALDLERMVRLAARLFDVPVAICSIFDGDRLMLHARVGIDLEEVDRDVSFCALTAQQDEITVIPDATEDDRFRTNPLVLGPPHVVFYAGCPLRTAGGHVFGTVCLIDTRPREPLGETERHNLADIALLITHRLEAGRLDDRRRLSLERFTNIAENSFDAIACADDTGRLIYWNLAAQRLFGYAADEIIGQPAARLVHPDSLPQYHARLDLLTGAEQRLDTDRVAEVKVIRKDHTAFVADVSTSTWREDGRVCLAGIVRDATERRANEDRLFRLASLDTLTGLANRGALQAQLAQELDHARHLTLVLLDLDGFKEVNDALGHSAGDTVLRMMASLLSARCPQAVQIARLGGDEFVVLLAGDDERGARAVAAGLTEAIAQPIDISGQVVEIGVSVGIAFAPGHGQNAEEIMTAADLALYRAKARGKGVYEIFTPALRQVSVARRAFERELRTAFDTGQFELFFQPQFRIDGTTLTGAEALIRWHHPARGVLRPAHFIDALARKPSAPEIGEWILRSACQTAALWRQRVPGFRMGVNLFGAQLRSRRFVDLVDSILRETGLPPEALELELVENIVLHHDTQAQTLLRELRRFGVGLAFDDYGTGFASLSLLKRVPVTRLKIDRSFIRDIDVDAENRAVTSAILFLARSFRVDVIAEGVETEAQLALLREMGCREAQGYYLGRPVSASVFECKFLPPKIW